MPRIHYALDLKDDPQRIADYEHWHRAENIWPSIVDSLAAAGIEDLEIFRAGNRLVMAMSVPDGFCEAAMAATLAANPAEDAWQALMWNYQQPLPFAAPGEKWVRMAPIFSLRQVLAARG